MPRHASIVRKRFASLTVQLCEASRPRCSQSARAVREVAEVQVDDPPAALKRAAGAPSSPKKSWGRCLAIYMAFETVPPSIGHQGRQALKRAMTLYRVSPQWALNRAGDLHALNRVMPCPQ